MKKSMLKVENLTLHREGEVHWFVTGDRHCGPHAMIDPVTGLLPVKYSITALCTPHLDHRGFLFDQLMVDSFLKELAAVETQMSCELLTEHVGHMLLGKIKEEEPLCEILWLEVLLSPAPHVAHVKAEFASASDVRTRSRVHHSLRHGAGLIE